MSGVEHCARCRRQFPGWDDSEPIYWEWVGPDGAELVCPGCVTGAEQRAIDEAEFRVADTTALEDPSDPRGDVLHGGAA